MCICSTLEQKAEVLTQEKQQTDAVVADMVAEKQQLLPQLEQSRWQCRQLEKKIEELQTTKEGVEKVSTMLRMDGQNSPGADALRPDGDCTCSDNPSDVLLANTSKST